MHRTRILCYHNKTPLQIVSQSRRSLKCIQPPLRLCLNRLSQTFVIDLFFVIFALPSSLSIYFGLEQQQLYLAAIGFGILLYGVAYFLVHDVLIHQRFKWFKHTKNRYLVGLRKAHKIHHKKLGKHDGKCFGMLFVPFKYFKKPKLS